MEGKTVAIINPNNIVGKPLMHLMLRNNVTPIICHSKTNKLKQITSKCDIIVVAMNKKEYITREYVKDNAIVIVIDVGVHKNFIPNFATPQYEKEKNIGAKNTEYKDNNRKFKNYRNQGKNINHMNKEKEEHINKSNILDTINIMILFAGVVVTIDEKQTIIIQ